MTNGILESILNLAKQIIILIQTILYSRAMKSYSKLLDTSFNSRWELLKEHFEYRSEVARERMRNERNLPA